MYIVVSGNIESDVQSFTINSKHVRLFPTKSLAEDEAKKWTKLHNKQHFVLCITDMLDVEQIVVKTKVK